MNHQRADHKKDYYDCENPDLHAVNSSHRKWIWKCHFHLISQFSFLAEHHALLSKFGNLSITEIFVVTSAYACPPARPPVRTDSGVGGGEFKVQPDGEGVENAIFPWRETTRCLWATGVFLAGKYHDHRRF